MEKLTVNGLKAIIKACKEAGVCKIDIGCVKIEFGAPVEKEIQQPTWTYSNIQESADLSQDPPESHEKPKQLDDFEMLNLLATDPQAYEDKILLET
jgi:hypothetical protein